MVELGRVGVVQLHMGFVAGQAQQEPDLLLADADLPLVAADGPRRQLVAQPAGFHDTWPRQASRRYSCHPAGTASRPGAHVVPRTPDHPAASARCRR
ncbi:hypothetical protein G6F23_015559 [Rhizopus arrhizus]|nr:hypothetical protein G6F23_015559 [Rhizopus arrhizus]